MPSPHPSSWIHVWLNLSYQSLIIATLNSFALWKRGIRSIMWPGNVFGTLYYLLCKHIMGCKSTFGPGCILIKRYQDLENQTGCSFPSFLSGRLKQTQARDHLRTTGIWPCTSWRARGLVSLQLCVISSSGLKSCFEILLPLKLTLHIPSTYIYKCTWDLRRWKVW